MNALANLLVEGATHLHLWIVVVDHTFSVSLAGSAQIVLVVPAVARASL